VVLKMTAFLVEVGKAVVKTLPATVARILLLVSIVAAFALHMAATARITALEHSDIVLGEQTRSMIDAVDALTVEVRGYREDMREENKLLRACSRQRPRPRQKGTSSSPDAGE
jgi:hypothetical protein